MRGDWTAYSIMKMFLKAERTLLNGGRIIIMADPEETDRLQTFTDLKDNNNHWGSDFYGSRAVDLLKDTADLAIEFIKQTIRFKKKK